MDVRERGFYAVLMLGSGGELERVDAASRASVRAEAAFRLRLGQLLEVLGRGGKCGELGFASIAAYALERAERSARWVEGARSLARRLEGLPGLRRAVAVGEVAWSKAELVARVAKAADEAAWVALARSVSLRQLRAVLQESLYREGLYRESLGVDVAETAGNYHAASDHAGSDHAANDNDLCTLTVTVDREEAWLFEATRSLLEAMGTRTLEEQLQALLAEGQGSLLAALPLGALDRVEELELRNVAQERWLEQLRRWREEAEARCEQQLHGARSDGLCSDGPRSDGARSDGAPGSVWAREALLGCAGLEGMSALELDRQVRELSSALARRELELSQLVLRLHRMNGWRRLGFATEGQYARERLGMSRSSLLARRGLGVKLEGLRGVAAALQSGALGLEAARQVVRVATARTEAAWVARAQQRTVKHLREEVNAALTAVRVSGEVDCPPPLERELDAFQELERAALRGGVPEGVMESGNNPLAASAEQSSERESRVDAGPASGERVAWSTMLQSLKQWLEGGVQISAGSAGRVVLRWRVSRETRAWWRALEADAAQWLARGVGWVRFLCLSLWRSWGHLLQVKVAYHRIYLRDRYRCSSPVCCGRDVTPHHLTFRSMGGGDEDENLVALCTWCHLSGVHEGRIRARGRAPQVRWELGSRSHPCVVVDGRVRVAC